MSGRPDLRNARGLMFTMFFQDDNGATSIEYAFIAAGIALAIIVVVNSVGSALVPVFRQVASGLS